MSQEDQSRTAEAEAQHAHGHWGAHDHAVGPHGHIHDAEHGGFMHTHAGEEPIIELTTTEAGNILTLNSVGIDVGSGDLPPHVLEARPRATGAGVVEPVQGGRASSHAPLAHSAHPVRRLVRHRHGGALEVHQGGLRGRRNAAGRCGHRRHHLHRRSRPRRTTRRRSPRFSRLRPESSSVPRRDPTSRP